MWVRLRADQPECAAIRDDKVKSCWCGFRSALIRQGLTCSIMHWTNNRVVVAKSWVVLTDRSVHSWNVSTIKRIRTSDGVYEAGRIRDEDKLWKCVAASIRITDHAHFRSRHDPWLSPTLPKVTNVPIQPYICLEDTPVLTTWCHVKWISIQGISIPDHFLFYFQGRGSISDIVTHRACIVFRYQIVSLFF